MIRASVRHVIGFITGIAFGAGMSYISNQLHNGKSVTLLEYVPLVLFALTNVGLILSNIWERNNKT